MKKLIFLLALSFSSASFSQSFEEIFKPELLDKIADKLPRLPGVICIKDQCNYIYYDNDGNHVLVAWTILHGQTFLGWRPVCLSCSLKGEAYRAINALHELVKSRFPEAEIGHEFQQVYR
jgi:hypothetical protein